VVSSKLRMAANELAQKIEELRRLAASARRKLGEISDGLRRLRGELREVAGQIGAAPSDDASGERDFEELQPTSGAAAPLPRHDA